jgi:hypothetical protein
LLPKQLEYRNYEDCTLNNNDNKTLLHGHYTLQPRGVLTDDIGTAEYFKSKNIEVQILRAPAHEAARPLFQSVKPRGTTRNQPFDGRN